MKKCPYCAEEIQDEAVVCRFCNRDLPPETPEQKVRREQLALIAEIKEENERLRQRIDALSKPSRGKKWKERREANRRGLAQATLMAQIVEAVGRAAEQEGLLDGVPKNQQAGVVYPFVAYVGKAMTFSDVHMR